MKKILSFITLTLAATFTGCTDLTTSLEIDTQTRFVFINGATVNYQWPGEGPESIIKEFEIGLIGPLADVPIKFTLVQTNANPSLAVIQVGRAGETFEDMSDKVFEIPAGENSVKVPIKLLRDDAQRLSSTLNSSQLQSIYYGWTTVFGLEILNAEEIRDLRLAPLSITIVEYRHDKVFQ